MLQILKHKQTQAVFFITILGIIISPFFAFAGEYVLPNVPNGLPNTTFLTLIVNIVDWLLGFVALIALLALIWGGIYYLTSAGDISRIEQGKKILTYAILGLLVVGTSYAIVGVVYYDWLEGSSGPRISNAQVIPTSGPPGTTFVITASISDPNGVDSTTTKAHIQNPDETNVATIDLYDDGVHSDGAAGDGTYGNTWTSGAIGAYYVDIVACDLKGNCGEAENI